MKGNSQGKPASQWAASLQGELLASWWAEKSLQQEEEEEVVFISGGWG